MHAAHLICFASLQQVAGNGYNYAENQENIANANDLEHEMIIAEEAV
jgi:hypothetical protein